MDGSLPHGKPVNTAGVAIIGGGIIGAATAYYLVRAGVKVDLFERSTIASEQSGRALGFLRCQGRHIKELPLAIEAAEIWKTLESDLSATFEYRNNGSLVVAESVDDEKLLRSSHARVVAAGSKAVVLTGDEIERLLPASAKRWRLGVFTPEDAAVDPPSATIAFSRAARDLGATIHTGAKVERIVVEKNKVVAIRVGGNVLKVSAVLCAAGVATNSLLRPIGHSLPIQVVRSPIVEVQLARPLFSFGLWTPYASIRPRPDGRFLLASGYRGEPSDHDLTVESALNFRHFASMFLSNSHRPKLRLNFESLRNLHSFGRRSTEMFSNDPPVNDAQIDNRVAFFKSVFPFDADNITELRRWSGRIDATPDLIPFIGPLGAIEGLAVAAGFSSHGLGISPVIAKGIAQFLTTGRLPANLEPFAPTRILERQFQHDAGAL